jgi:hypothetical protein
MLSLRKDVMTTSSAVGIVLARTRAADLSVRG